MKVILGLLLSFSSLPSLGATPEMDSFLSSHWSQFKTVYEHLHSNPELSLHEKQTAAYIAAKLKSLGFQVSENVGGTGVIGVLKNGDGPVLFLRSDMDALPVKENTHLPYASRTTTQKEGKTIPVMHACGHDVHMTVLLGSTEYLLSRKADWKGTLVTVFQPAEELGLGAKAMIDGGLFKKIPKPTYGVALHVSADDAVGTVGVHSGYAMANADTVYINVKGAGGHGAFPHKTKDPVVLAARIILALQTIVTREIGPTDPSVISVGYVSGGTKSNVIPDSVELRATVRSFSPETRKQILEAIKRTSIGIAQSAGFPKSLYPEVTTREGYTPSLFNDPALVTRVKTSLSAALGEENVVDSPAVMGAEDFGRYGQSNPKFPITMMWLGSVSPSKVKKSRQGKLSLPSLHSSLYAPEAKPTIETGVRALSAVALDLLKPTQTEQKL